MSKWVDDSGRKAYEFGGRVAEGKTKVLFGILGEPDYVEVFSKDAITKGDGAVKAEIAGKGALAVERSIERDTEAELIALRVGR